jgi:hypothetical protein
MPSIFIEVWQRAAALSMGAGPTKPELQRQLDRSYARISQSRQQQEAEG